MCMPFTTADYRHGMDVRDLDQINRWAKTCKYLLCEYAEPGAELQHEVFHAKSWHRTATAANNARRRQSDPHVVLMFHHPEN